MKCGVLTCQTELPTVGEEMLFLKEYCFVMRRKEMGIFILKCIVKPYDLASAACCSNTGTAWLEKDSEVSPTAGFRSVDLVVNH
jgi:hypothetical protein